MIAGRILVVGPEAAPWTLALSAAGLMPEVIPSRAALAKVLEDGTAQVILLGPDPPPSLVEDARRWAPTSNIIAVTETEGVQHAAAGSDEVLHAPVVIPDLVAAVSRGLERSKLLAVAQGEHAAEVIRVLDVLARATDPQTLLVRLLRRLLAGVGGDRASAMLPEGPGGELRIAAHLGLNRPPSHYSDPEALSPSVGSVSGWVARERRPLLLRGSASDDPRIGAPTGEALAALCVPLLSAGRLIGVINISDTKNKGSYTQADLDFVVGVAGVAGSALERAMLMESIVLAKAEWQGAFDAYSVPIALMAPDLTVNRVNAAFATAAGIAPMESVGQRLSGLIPGPIGVIEAAAQDAMESRKDVQMLGPNPFGARGRVRVEVSPRFEGGFPMAAVVVVRSVEEGAQA